MSIFRFALIAGPALIVAATSAAAADVFDINLLYVVTVGCIMVVIAARFAVLGDSIMAWVVVATFLILVGVGVVNGLVI